MEVLLYIFLAPVAFVAGIVFMCFVPYIIAGVLFLAVIAFFIAISIISLPIIGAVILFKKLFLGGKNDSV